jgi:hypothetical protein
MNTTLEYSTRVVQEGDRRSKKSILNDLVHLTPLRIPLMNPVSVSDQMQNLPNYFTTQNKMTSENDIEGLASLKFLRP